MSINGIGGASNSNPIASAVAEATETHAQTVKEAHNGDRVAQRKLQKQQQAQQANQASGSEPGKGEALDHHG